MMCKRFPGSLLLLLLLFPLGLAAQSVDSISTVPPKAKKEKVQNPYPGFFTYDEAGNPIPRKTVTYSLIFPGLGQAYNRRWWKLPLVYGAVGGVIYAIDFNQSRYRQFRNALELELQGQPHQFSEFEIDATTLRSLRDTYDRYTQLSYMGIILVYGVIAIESFVDAHLQNFDISEDLSLGIKPDFRLAPLFQTPTVGVSVVWTIP